MNNKIDQIIRVDHAGEYGAKRIYEGQLRFLKGKPSYETVKEMAEQEEEHLEYFESAMKEKGTRPTALMPLWHVGAYALGAGTALLGEKAAMACTVAVEDVIEKHYAEQIDSLEDNENSDLKAKIKKFRDDELEHHHTGLEHDAEQAPAYKALSAGIRFITKSAINISKHI